MNVLKMFAAFQLDLALQYETGADLTNFMPNGEWSLLGEMRMPMAASFMLFLLLRNAWQEECGDL